MIGITGANGNLGSAMVARAVERVGRGRVAAIARNAEAAKERLDGSVAIRRADYEDKASLVTAFKGLERLVLIPGAGSPAARRVQHDNVIEAAEEAGVRHVVYAGFIDNDAASPFWPAATIAYTEGRLVASSLQWTFLRNGVYAHLVAGALGPARDHGVYLTSAATGAACYASLQDLAEASAIVATGERHEGKSYRLCGERATETDIAAILGRVVGRDVALEVVSEGRIRDLMGEMGEMVVGMHRAIAGGFFDRPTDDLETLLGHPPMDIATASSQGELQ